MFDLLNVDTAKQWLRFEDTYTDEDTIIGLLCKNAEIYIKRGIGEHYNLTEENRMQAQLIAMILVTNWYENRDVTGNVEHITEKARKTVDGLMLQLRLSVEEATI